jgi:Fic family protein
MATQESTRAGAYQNQLTGEMRYRAFIPKPLPPDPPINMDMELVTHMSDADRALARLDAMAEILPNPDLFVAMYVRKESVLSSQIEGTQTSLVDLLEYETERATRNLPADVGEVVNYVRAINYGIDRLKQLPISLRLIRDTHAVLLEGVRGQDRQPGEFRKSQNWIGPPGCRLTQAAFVPPPAEMQAAMGDLEKFIHDPSHMPALLKIGMVHAQFETIHPFLDGNGRIGRLLITLMLCEQGILSQPLLYLSYYFKQNRQEYYDRLTAIRQKGDWEGWLKFFLRGVYEVSRQATDTARRVISLREEHRALVDSTFRGAANALRLLDKLYDNPIINVKAAKETLDVTMVSANKMIAQFAEAGLIGQISPGRRNRVFAYRPYLDLFVDPETSDALPS